MSLTRPHPEPPKMITLRVSPAEREAIREAAWRARKSMNLFCIEVLLKAAEAEKRESA